MKGYRSKLITAVIAALLIAALYMLYGYWSGMGGEVGVGEPFKGQVKTVKASAGELKITVAATGTVTPEVEVMIKSKAGGEIKEFPFNEGDSLKRGEVVVRLDPETEKTRVRQHEANLLMAEAKLDKARVSLKDSEMKLQREKKLFNEGIISRQEYDDAIIALERARSDQKIAGAEVIQTKERLKEAETLLDDTVIKAPLTGTILKKFVDEGQIISSTLSSASEGTPLFSMANLEKLYVKAMVDEVDIARVSPGDDAEVTVDGLPGRSFKGKVVRIAPQGRVERTVTVFETWVEVYGANSLLKPGMTADVEIITEMKKGALIVPNESLKLLDGKTGLYVMRGGAPAFTAVETGLTNGMVTEILSGLKAGDEVVVSGLKEQGARNGTQRDFLSIFRRKR